MGARLRRMRKLTGYYLRRWVVCRRSIRIANYRLARIRVSGKSKRAWRIKYYKYRRLVWTYRSRVQNLLRLANRVTGVFRKRLLVQWRAARLQWIRMRNRFNH